MLFAIQEVVSIGFRPPTPPAIHPLDTYPPPITPGHLPPRLFTPCTFYPPCHLPPPLDIHHLL